MSGEAEALYQQALNLAADERYQLAQRLLGSLAEDELPDDPEFRAELDRRLQAVADGTGILIPWEEAAKPFGLNSSAAGPSASPGTRRDRPTHRPRLDRCHRLGGLV